MRVIGTAGHVDHGKSTLITALTGKNPDRLKEEQERLMTIDLGFAWMTLPDGEEIGFIDVPGHEKYIDNMLAGLGGLDAAMLVIAADEGIMPQTREHLAILDILELKNLFVVLTKIDLVEDPEWLELIDADVRGLLRQTRFESSPILQVSSTTKQGFPELINTLAQIGQLQPVRPDLGRPRLSIDRVFTITGFGTIVTGTLIDGKFSLNEEVEILPAGWHARIRGLQTHKKKIDVAVPGSRLGVNLSGINVEQIRRGEVLTHPGQYNKTTLLDVRFKMMRDVVDPLRHNTEVKLFLNTSQTTATIRLLGKEILEAGETGWLQLELNEPILAVRGDHYILRRPSPGKTLGGGIIVEPRPKLRHKRFDEVVLSSLRKTSQGSPSEVILQTCLTRGPAARNEILAGCQLDETVAESAIEDLTQTGKIILLEDYIITTSQWRSQKESIQETLTAFHEAFPLRSGINREELRSRLKLSTRLCNLFIQKLVSENTLIDSDKWISLKVHTVHFSESQQVTIDNLLKLFSQSPYSPPSVKECQAQVGEEVFSALLEKGRLISISSEVVFYRNDYDVMVKEIQSVLQQKGEISIAEVRDLFHTSRRYAQALLEHLDSIGATFRSGDYHKKK